MVGQLPQKIVGPRFSPHTRMNFSATTRISGTTAWVYFVAPCYAWLDESFFPLNAESRDVYDFKDSFVIIRNLPLVMSKSVLEISQYHLMYLVG